MVILGRSLYDDPASFIDNGQTATLYRVLKVAQGENTVTLNGATPVTVANKLIQSNSVVLFTLKTVGGTVGAAPVIATITPGTGFTVKGTALDTSTYNYVVIN